MGDYVISACNVGASIAGTGKESYGAYFQRGNNYPFPTTGGVMTGTTLVDASFF
ncbi:MAG: hypothetical protein LBG52_03005 [Candidatus Peribacteria bacterium]|nr:hypothetical protein [Candidatus Peribacteria bacterium]